MHWSFDNHNPKTVDNSRWIALQVPHCRRLTGQTIHIQRSCRKSAVSNLMDCSWNLSTWNCSYFGSTRSSHQYCSHYWHCWKTAQMNCSILRVKGMTSSRRDSSHYPFTCSESNSGESARSSNFMVFAPAIRLRAPDSVRKGIEDREGHSIRGL